MDTLLETSVLEGRGLLVNEVGLVYAEEVKNLGVLMDLPMKSRLVWRPGVPPYLFIIS